MASARASSFRCVWFPILVLAIAMLLPAQTPQAVPAAPQNAQFQNLIPAAQLAFLNNYSGKTTKELKKDKQFRGLLKQIIPHTIYHYGHDLALSEAVDDALSGSRLPVNIRDGRYVTVSGLEGPYLRGRGFLWFDLQDGIVLGGFFFAPINGEPSPTLTVFSRQIAQTQLSLSQLPRAFADDMSQWAAVSRVPVITARYFIPENGKKYVLVHDEDYCWHPEGSPAPPEFECMQANLDAADVDMDAALFMQETHNAANATAWRLSPAQTAWLGLRDSTCGGAGALGCRVRVTRERVRVILGPPPPPRPRPI